MRSFWYESSSSRSGVFEKYLSKRALHFASQFILIVLIVGDTTFDIFSTFFAPSQITECVVDTSKEKVLHIVWETLVETFQHWK